VRISYTLQALISAVCLMAAPQIIAQQQQSTLQAERKVVVPAPPSWGNTPTDEGTTQPASPREKVLRQNRSDSFNDRLGLAPRLEDNARTGKGVGRTVDGLYIPPLPVDSAIVVLASVLSAQSHLSTDHTAIYTELKVQIEKILKDNTASLVPNGYVDILERGGSVNLNGQTLRYPVSASLDLIDVGKRYMLFLYTKPAVLDAFGVTKAWLLEKNHPQPAGAYRAGAEDVAPYVTMTESEFTSYVQRAIQAHSTR
jgi:hypothetical protein